MGAIADAIMAFAQPLIDETDGSLEQMNQALSISQACWNLALLPEDERQSVIDDLQSTLEMSASEFADFKRAVLAPMIRRHEEMFPGLHQRSSRPSSPHWETRSLLAPAARSPQGKSSQPGRYEPCPCGSGKKYKFCCERARG
jgi:uncharacterized protein YecA (UPF0149 family)